MKNDFTSARKHYLQSPEINLAGGEWRQSRRLDGAGEHLDTRRFLHQCPDLPMPNFPR